MLHVLLASASVMSVAITHEVGQKAPQFNCADSKGEMHDLSAYTAAGKTVILYFYPRDFRDNMARLSSESYIVLGVSKGSEGSHEKFITKKELSFPLLMDQEGVLHESYGTWRLKKNYGREYMGCSRSTFVIGPDGTFSWLRYNVKAKGHVGMLLRELGLTE